MGKINLNAQAVKIRENRLGSITGFNGTADELVKLGQCGKLKDSTRSFSQCMGCSSGNAFCQLSIIKDAAVINHAPVGCSADFWGSHVFDDLLKELGYEAKYIVPFSTVAEFENILESAATIQICSTLGGAKLGIPTLLIGDEQFGFGYQGILNYAERILETIGNEEFVTNLSKHSTISYTKWWLKQDPFTFLGGGTSVKHY